jgi:hypothetical protein
MTPQEVLSGAADLIEEHGWVRGEYGGEEHGFCAMGAILYRSHGYALAYNRARQRLMRELVHSGSIVFWNDNVAKSKDEVVETLRRVAADA